MDVVNSNFMPGDPRLIQQLVYELKSQGIFDQFRKECIADVDTKPAYQNLRQRVEGSVTSFLKQQTWRPDMNKNQVREQLRKNIYESGYLEAGVERIVDQVVNPKINTVFLPQVEEVVYRYLGIEKPNRTEVKKEMKIDVTDLLPTDLEAVSPESDHTDRKDDYSSLNDSLNTDSKIEEDESPPFEPLEVEQSLVQHEENSVDSHLSGFSGLQSHESNPYTDTKIVELSNQDSQVSHNSSESHLSIIVSDENTKMEVCEESESKIVKSSDSETKTEIHVPTPINAEQETAQKETEEVEHKSEADTIEQNKKDDKKSDQKKYEDKKSEKKNEDKKSDEKKHDDKKSEKKSDVKKSRSSDKHGSKDKKDDKKNDKKDDKHRKSSSSGKDREKSSSRNSSSSSSKDKDKNKERKEVKVSSSSGKEKDKNAREKEKQERERSDKDKPDKDREKNDKDKSKSFSSRHSSSSSTKDKEKSSSSKKESSSKDKEKSRSSSLSTSRDSKSKSNHADSKSKSSSADKHKKNDKSSHNNRPSSSSSSTKRDKDKKREGKKESKDDHYSAKEKKNHRRSTDRDSNDGQSSKHNYSNSLTGSSSSYSQKNNHETSNLNTGNGSGNSGNSDEIEQSSIKSPTKLVETIENKEVIISCNDVQKFKYIKPKFASNFQEARKLMKIRKQLAKLEKQNQLSLAQIEIPLLEQLPTVNGISSEQMENIEEIDKAINLVNEPETPEKRNQENILSPKVATPVLQSTNLSKESWEALEARLAQEMSNVNYNSYESQYDDYDCAGYNSIIISPRKKVYEEKCTVTKDTLADTRECSIPNEVGSETVKIASAKIEEDFREVPAEEIGSVDVRNNGLDKSKCIFKVTECISKEKFMENEEKCKPLIIYDMQNYTENKEPDQAKKTASDKRITKNLQVILRNEQGMKSTLDIDDQCRYLEKPSPSFHKHLEFIYKYIEKLERAIEHSKKSSQNNCLPLKRGRKRKLVENVDLKNNNKAHYEQTPERKKRRRSIAPNTNSLISKPNKEKICNSTDISPNDSFSLPLSPAESDKSNDKKEDSPKPTKQKRNIINKNTSSRCQRYSSDDLYKPRPMIASTRRSRGAKNPGN